MSWWQEHVIEGSIFEKGKGKENFKKNIQRHFVDAGKQTVKVVSNVAAKLSGFNLTPPPQTPTQTQLITDGSLPFVGTPPINRAPLPTDTIVDPKSVELVNWQRILVIAAIAFLIFKKKK